MYRRRIKTILLLIFAFNFLLILLSCHNSDEPEETIIFTIDYHDGETPVTQIIPKNSKVSKPPTKVRENLIFEGWYQDSEFEEKFKFNKRVHEDTIIHAKYTIDYETLNAKIHDVELKSHVGIKITYYNRFMSSWSWGSGVIIEMTDSKFYILSNCHLSKKNHGMSNIRYEIYDYENNYTLGQLVFDNSEYDLAIFECDRFGNELELIDFGQDYRIGEEIVSIGRPLGNPNNITYGVINGYVPGPELTCDKSQSNVKFDVIMHDSYINLGSSGGALLNLDLELIGIQYAVKQDDATYEFINGYAIPLFRVYEFLDMYEEFKLTNA